MILRLAIVGFGNVGQEFAKLLLSRREWLVRSKGLDVEVIAIVTRTRGTLSSKIGLDLQRVLDELKVKGNLNCYGPELTEMTPLQVIDKSDADMMMELSTLNIDSGQPAIDHVRAAMNVGMDVITANKGPIAFAYRDLRNLARSRNVHFRFEGTVMDGTPIFNLVEKTLPGCRVVGLEGVLNSTSNFVLTEMSSGRSMQDAVKEAQRRGFAEADPSLDIDGWDAAAKIAALANVMMNANTNPRRVVRKGIRDISSQAVADAARNGKKYRLIAKARPEGDDIRLEVGPEVIVPESPFWSVDGTSSALTIRTDLMGDITIIEGNPAVAQTAYAVFSDMLLVVDAIRSGTI